MRETKWTVADRFLKKGLILKEKSLSDTFTWLDMIDL